MDDLAKFVYKIIQQVPRTVLYLDPAYKTYDYFLAQIEGLVRGVYNGHIAGEFIDVMGNLISGQIQDAYDKAWREYDQTETMPDYLKLSYQEFVSRQYTFVDQFYRDIVDAMIDKTSIEPLLTRAKMWANRYNDAVNEANRAIVLENGGNLIWTLGDAEHCHTCLSLDGKVASAREWDISGWKPQSQKLECHGYNCACSLEPTDQRRSPKVLEYLNNVS